MQSFNDRVQRLNHQLAKMYYEIVIAYQEGFLAGQTSCGNTLHPEFIKEIGTAFHDGFTAGCSQSDSPEVQENIRNAVKEAKSNGYAEGLIRGEKISHQAHYYIQALEKICRTVREHKYILSNEEPSSMGIDNPVVLELYNIAFVALGLDDEKTT